MDFSHLKNFLPQIIATGIALLLWLLIKLSVKKLIHRYGHSTQKVEARMKQVNHVTAILLNIIFIFSVAIIWGVRPQNLFLGLSSVVAVLGVALFAQWSVLSNVTAGIVMFFSAPYRVGDRIRIVDKDAPIEATIEVIGTFYSHIRTEDGELIVLPNNLFLQKIVAIKEERE